MDENETAITSECAVYHTAAATAVESVSLFFIMVISFVANLSIIIVVLRNRSLRRNGHNLLILNLALADFGDTIGSMFITFLAILNGGKILKRRDILCSVNVFMSGTFYFANFGAINLIAIHRYLLVVHSNRLNVTLNSVYVMMSACWGLSALVSLTPAIGKLSPVIYDPTIHNCRVKWEDPDGNCWVASLFLMLNYFISVPVMLFCYTSIAIEIRNSQLKINEFRQRVRGSIRRLTGRKEKVKSMNNLQDLEGDQSSSTQISVTDESAFYSSKSGEEDKSTRGQLGNDKRKAVLIKNWNEYEVEYQEICHTLRRAGSMLNGAANITRSRYKNRSTVEMRDRTLKSVLGADKLVAIAGALVILTTTICWLPYSITHSCMLRRNRENKCLHHGVDILTRWLAYSNCAMDPLIYSMFNRGLQAALLNGYRGVYRRMKSCF